MLVSYYHSLLYYLLWINISYKYNNQDAIVNSSNEILKSIYGMSLNLINVGG